MTAEMMEVDNSLNNEPNINIDVLDVTTEKDGGVLKEIKKEGSGHANPNDGDRVIVHYVGTLTDGTKFDSSRDRGEYFEFNLGKGEVIKAWDLGVASMKKGEIAVFTCKPEYAYGQSGSPPKIPADATLIFEIELIDWKGEDLSKNKDGGILRKVLNKGEGYTSPSDGATVQVHLLGRYNENLFENRDVTFILGEGMEHGICQGLEIALEKFKKGEKSLITLQPQYAFGSSGKPELGVPGNQTVEYEVTLKTFERAKESWEMDIKEKLEQSRILKERGTHYLQIGKCDLAIKKYSKIIDFLEHEKDKEDSKTECESLLLASYLNLALTNLKLNEMKKVCENCDKALQIDNKNEKAFFRRALAYIKMNEFELGLADLNEVLKLDPENKAAQREIALCKVHMAQAREKEKQLYANMFKIKNENFVNKSDEIKIGAGDGQQNDVK